MDNQQHIFNKQEELQNRFGVHFPIEHPEVKAQYIKDQVFWAIDELHEMVHEVPFIKHWKKYDLTKEEYEAHLQKAREEFVDAWHFLTNVGLALDFTSDQLREMYDEKNKINHKRQDEGY